MKILSNYDYRILLNKSNKLNDLSQQINNKNKYINSLEQELTRAKSEGYSNIGTWVIKIVKIKSGEVIPNSNQTIIFLKSETNIITQEIEFYYQIEVWQSEK